MKHAERRRDTLRRLTVLHQKVDTQAADVAAAHAGRLHCGRGCTDCCADDLTVLEVEADRIRDEFGELLAQQAPHPPGACAMLAEDGACRIYAARPYICRTQGLPLHVFSESEEGDIVEQRDICPLNAEGPPLGALDEAAVWLVGPTELELVELQEAHSDEVERVALRSLFSS